MGTQLARWAASDRGVHSVEGQGTPRESFMTARKAKREGSSAPGQDLGWREEIRTPTYVFEKSCFNFIWFYKVRGVISAGGK